MGIHAHSHHDDAAIHRATDECDRNRLNHGGIQSTDSTMSISIAIRWDIFYNKQPFEADMYFRDCIMNLHQRTFKAVCNISKEIFIIFRG